MVSVLGSSTVDRGLGPRPDQTKVYKDDICCFSVKHKVLRNKSNDIIWLLSNLSTMSVPGERYSKMSNLSAISRQEQVTFNEMMMLMKSAL
jgi:hypothetical protein